jgi:hypothetical protein
MIRILTSKRQKRKQSVRVFPRMEPEDEEDLTSEESVGDANERRKDFRTMRLHFIGIFFFFFFFFFFFSFFLF